MGEHVLIPYIAKYYQSENSFDIADTKIINSISEKRTYKCSYIFSITNDNFDYSAYKVNKKRLTKALINQISIDPTPFFEHLYCSSSLIWRINPSAIT